MNRKLIKELKYKRLTNTPAKKFLVPILLGLKEVYHDEYPDRIFYHLKGEILFESNGFRQVLTCHYRKIWYILREQGYSNDEVQNFIKNQFKIVLGIDVFIPTDPSLGYEKHMWSQIEIPKEKFWIRIKKIFTNE